MIGKLLDRTECQILLYIGDSKSFMSKSHYLQCKSLHSLPKFASKTQRIQIRNGQYISVLFIIPVVIDIHSCRFEIFTLVSQIYENIDWAFGIKNIFEWEGIISSWESCFSFLNRSLPFFSKEEIVLKLKEQKLIKVEAPFVDEISGLVIVKMLDKKPQSTVILKLKFVWYANWLSSMVTSWPPLSSLVDICSGAYISLLIIRHLQIFVHMFWVSKT